MGNWFRGIVQNLISNAVWVIASGLLGGLAVLLAYLTPAIRVWAPLSYLLALLVVLLLISIVAYFGIRTYRHYKPAPLSIEPPASQSKVNDSLKAVVDSFGKLEDKFNDLAKLVASHEVDLEDAKDGATSLRTSIQGFMSVAVNHATELHKQTTDLLSRSISALDEARLTGQNSLKSEIDEIRRGCATLDDAFRRSESSLRESVQALIVRDELGPIADEIEARADELYLALKNGEKYDKQRWESWESIRAHWEIMVTGWVDTARWYAKNVKHDVFTVDDREYDQEHNWGVNDDQFPSADAVRRYKRHRLIHAHWRAVRSKVDGNVLMVARGLMSEKECHCGQFHQ